MKSLVVALLLVLVANAWLWKRTASSRGLRAALLAADGVLLGVAWLFGGDAVLGLLGLGFLVVVIPVVVRELGSHDHPEVLNPDRIQRFRSGR